MNYKNKSTIALIGLYSAASLSIVEPVNNTTVENIFTNIYKTNKWGSKESISGPGSEVGNTSKTRHDLEQLIALFKIQSFADAPCGDFNWMRLINFGSCSYTGYDIVKELTDKNTQRYANASRKFKHWNLIEQPIEKADLVLCRDLLAHLTFDQIFSVIRNFKKSGTRFLLATTHPNVQQNLNNIGTGDWRKLNLEKPPFSFPKPIVTIEEKNSQDYEEGKLLGLWLLADLKV